jgi:hypothetical protein
LGNKDQYLGASYASTSAKTKIASRYLLSCTTKNVIPSYGYSLFVNLSANPNAQQQFFLKN